MPAFPFQPRETPLIFERSRAGRPGTAVPKPLVAQRAADVLPAGALRASPPDLPEVPEFEVVRHYIELSLKNHHVDRALYPLGSCTMKYNPKVNEDMARLPGFAELHPFAPDVACQGALRLMHTLGEWLKDIGGMDAITLQPSAGAQGEMTGIFLIAAYHRARGDTARKTVIIPDSAHGTNPATAALAGFVVKAIKSDARGQMDLATLKAALGPDTAALMLTLPNTVGRFETEVTGIAQLVHEAGALLYADGANMKKVLESRGYKVDLQYAEDDIPAQVAQVENMITKGDKVLVIAAIDGAALFNVLEQAHAAGVQIISYDRLIINSPWVSYYATFDNFKVGVLQGGYIVKALGLQRHFRVVLPSTDAGVAKPDRRIFLEALRRLGARPAQAISSRGRNSPR